MKQKDIAFRYDSYFQYELQYNFYHFSELSEFSKIWYSKNKIMEKWYRYILVKLELNSIIIAIPCRINFMQRYTNHLFFLSEYLDFQSFSWKQL